MTDHTQAAAQHPSFRRGFTPEAMGYEPIHYRPLTRATAERAWRGLVTGGATITGAAVIAATMGVSEEMSRRCRRVFDALGLITNQRGVWNQPRKHGDWSPMEENVPARVLLHDRDPEALSRTMADYDHDVMFYVASKDTSGPSIADQTVPSLRSGWSRSNVVIWRSGRGASGLPEYVTEQFVSGPVAQSCSSSWYATSTDTNGSHTWVETTPAPTLFLVEDDRARLRAKRAAPSGPLLAAQGREGIKVGDLMAAYGWSRKTTYRRLDEWKASGKARQVARGRYVLIGVVK